MSRPGPALFTIAVALSCIAIARGGRDFTVHDIAHLYPATTPFPGGFKCFTCHDARDNYECNRWAPDVFCAQGSRYCYTHHVMDGRGASESVTKRCAALRDCVGATGCRTLARAAGAECVSCCEGNICNLPVPRNSSDAVFSTETPVWPSGAPRRPSLAWPPLLCAVLCALTLPA